MGRNRQERQVMQFFGAHFSGEEDAGVGLNNAWTFFKNFNCVQFLASFALLAVPVWSLIL
jgi:hypothetical protein